MSICFSKTNGRKSKFSEENRSIGLSGSVNRRISSEEGESTAKKSDEETVRHTFFGNDDYWCRGPISARFCGTMLWSLHSRVSLEMTIDKSLRMANYNSNTVCAVSADGRSCAIMHDIGVAYAHADRVEVRGCDAVGKNDRYAKMVGSAIAFSTVKSGVVYVLDEAGVQTTSTAKMTNLSNDISFYVFLDGCKCGRQFKKEAIEIIAESYYRLEKDGTQKWLVNGVNISYTKVGVLSVWRKEEKIRMTTDLNGTARISTPRVNMAVIGGKQPHLIVRRNDLKVTYNGSKFVTENSNQSVGLDKDGLLMFYD